jgi:lysophospholipase L1-like esterase
MYTKNQLVKLARMTALCLLPLAGLHAAEWHVAVTGKDSQRGTKDDPLQTIQRAADLAQPGDSITEQHLYTNYVEAWAITRFPSWDLKFTNVGIGGDGAGGGDSRFKRDVLSYGATVLTVNFGMNDCGGPGNDFNQDGFNGFTSRMQGIANQAKAANIRVAWCTTTPAEVMDEGPSVLPFIQKLESDDQEISHVVRDERIGVVAAGEFPCSGSGGQEPGHIRTDG